MIVQTFHPEHYAVRCAAAYDYEGFAKEELEARKDLGYPPFTRLVRILLQGPKADAVEKAVAAVAEALRRALPILPSSGDVDGSGPPGSIGAVTLLGPVPAPISQIKGRHRMQIMLKAGDLGTVLPALRKLRAPHGIQMAIDVDPVSFQ